MEESPTGIRVIIFDQNETYRKVIAMYLKTRGYDVTEASSPDVCPVPMDEICGRDACEPCAHVFISCLNQPDTKGLKFLEEQISKGCKARQMALILGHHSPEEEARANELGLHVFHLPMGLARVKEWIDRVSARPEAGSWGDDV